MRYFRSLDTRFQLSVSVLVSAALLMQVLVVPSEADILEIDIHDGTPWTPNVDAGDDFPSGNFFTLDPVIWILGFRVQRVWFYHEGQYPDSGEPYEVQFFYRLANLDGSESFAYIRRYSATTTCNACWESLSTSFDVYPGGDPEGVSIGAFVVPLGGTPASPSPMVWRDRYPNVPHSGAILDIGFWAPPPYVWYYFSDYGMGEVMLGMEISSDGIVGTEDTSFSTIKSLY